MRTTLTIILLSLLLAATGCGRITTSGIPNQLNSDTPIQTAGHPQGITLSPPGSHGESWDLRSVETERRFYATISSGTSGQLMAAYRQEVERIITSTGAKIHETGIIGTEHDVLDFSYGYAWHATDGIIRASSFTGTNGQVQVVIFCYEHRR